MCLYFQGVNKHLYFLENFKKYTYATALTPPLGQKRQANIRANIVTTAWHIVVMMVIYNT